MERQTSIYQCGSFLAVASTSILARRVVCEIFVLSALSKIRQTQWNIFRAIIFWAVIITIITSVAIWWQNWVAGNNFLPHRCGVYGGAQHLCWLVLHVQLCIHMANTYTQRLFSPQRHVLVFPACTCIYWFTFNYNEMLTTKRLGVLLISWLFLATCVSIIAIRPKREIRRRKCFIYETYTRSVRKYCTRWNILGTPKHGRYDLGVPPISSGV